MTTTARLLVMLVGAVLVTLSLGSTEEARALPPPGEPAPTSTIPASFEGSLDALLDPLIEGAWAYGMVVGVVTEGETKVFSFGKLSEDDATPPSEDTLFEIGSVTKALTGTLLAELVTKGEVSLDTTAQSLVPQGVVVPKRGKDEITLLDLATHTSGLPLIPKSFWPKEPGSIYDPNYGGKGWSTFGDDKLWAYLAAPDPPVAPKKAYLYSNLGMGLLGRLLALAEKTTYAALLTERILAPLGMKSTFVVVPPEAQGRLAPGHDADGVPTDPWTTSALDGAFVLESSLADLLRFVEANLGLVDTPLGEAMALAQKTHFKRNTIEGVGLGWNTSTYGVVYHTGATGGHRAAVFMLPAKKVGIVVMTNNLVGGSTDGRALLFDMVAGSVLNLLVGAAPLPAPFPQQISASPVHPVEYVGTYAKAPGASKALVVTLDDGKLTALLPGRVPNRLYPEGDDAFFMKAYDARFVFVRGASGVVEAVGLELSGKKVQLKKW